MAQVKTLLVWGDTQVGKTTLLTTAFYHDTDRLAVIDRQKSFLAVAQPLLTHWKRLSTCQWVQPTSEAVIDIDVTTRSGTTLRFRDVKGDLVRQVDNPDVEERLAAADGVLFVLEWQPKDAGRQMLAIEGSWMRLGDRPVGLVFTKCETQFEESDEIWAAPSGWWRRGERWRDFEDTIQKFGDAVWPTSAYGYAQATGQPAVIIGEFGQLLPYGIRPKGVAEPFEWMIDKIQAR